MSELSKFVQSVQDDNDGTISIREERLKQEAIFNFNQKCDILPFGMSSTIFINDDRFTKLNKRLFIVITIQGYSNASELVVNCSYSDLLYNLRVLTRKIDTPKIEQLPEDVRLSKYEAIVSSLLNDLEFIMNIEAVSDVLYERLIKEINTSDNGNV